MQQSEFNRAWCRRLCTERAINMEIARLEDKQAMMEDHGQLTPAEVEEDSRRRTDADRLFAIGDGG